MIFEKHVLFFSFIYKRSPFHRSSSPVARRPVAILAPRPSLRPSFSRLHSRLSHLRPRHQVRPHILLPLHQAELRFLPLTWGAGGTAVVPRLSRGLLLWTTPETSP